MSYFIQKNKNLSYCLKIYSVGASCRAVSSIGQEDTCW